MNKKILAVLLGLSVAIFIFFAVPRRVSYPDLRNCPDAFLPYVSPKPCPQLTKWVSPLFSSKEFFDEMYAELPYKTSDVVVAGVVAWVAGGLVIALVWRRKSGK